MIDEGMRALAEALRQQSAAYGFVARAATIISMRAIEGCALI